MIIFEELYCGWVCPECCEKFGWIEDRYKPEGEKVECENCDKEWTEEVKGWKNPSLYTKCKNG